MTYNTDIIIKFIDDFFKNKENSKIKNEEHYNNLNIKGKWGSGKTTYIKKLKEKITELKNEDNTNKYQVKIFNVWEYEISDNIFISILCDILNLVYDKEKDTDYTKNSLKQALKNLAFIGGYGLTYALDFWIPRAGETIRGCLDKKSELNKNKKGNNIAEKKYNDPLFELIKKNQYYDLIDNTIQIIKNLIGDKKYIIIFDELDRCTAPKMIEFLSIIKNILFKLDNCFFIVSCDSDRVNKILKKDDEENYTDKILYTSINIEILSYFDKTIIYTENKLISNYLEKISLENDYRKIKKAINRSKKIISFLKNEDDNFPLFSYDFIAFWIYYKNIDLLKSNKNLSLLNLKLLFEKASNKISNYTKNTFFKKKQGDFTKDKYEFCKILNTNSDCFLRVYTENKISIPFAIFIPFIEDITNFDFKNLLNVIDIEDKNTNLRGTEDYSGDYLEYKNIHKYLEKNVQELFDEYFNYYKYPIFIKLDISIKKYFEYMLNII